MTSINGVGSNLPIHKVVNPPSVAPVAAEPPSAIRTRAADKLELSGASYLLKTLKDSEVRTEKVAAIRAQIEAGTYEDEAKLNTAIDRLMDDLDL